MTSTTAYYIDCHLHLQDERLSDHLEQLMADCRAAGVQRMVVNGTQPNDWEAVAKLAQSYPEVSASYGLHPWHVNSRPDDWLDQLRSYASSNTTGIGEIGLDKWVRDHDLDAQKLVFRQQVALAHELNLPVTIHCLRAWGHMIEELQNAPQLERGFLLHSYAGPREMVPSFVDLGAYFSLSGYFFHERKLPQLKTFLNVIPPERLLLETDAPDMALSGDEAPFNHPANIVQIYKTTAQRMGIPINELSEGVRQRFEKLFGPAT